MRLSDNGRFAPRKFDRAVELAAREHYDGLMSLIKQQGGAYGAGVEYAEAFG